MAAMPYLPRVEPRRTTRGCSGSLSPDSAHAACGARRPAGKEGVRFTPMRAPTALMAGGPKPFLTAVGAGAIALAVATSAFGQEPSTQTFTTSQSEFTAGVRNQGWWSGQPTILNDDSNANYVASRGDGASEENFFTFDLRGLRASCAVRAATLRLTRFEGSGTGVLSYQLWDVSTPAAILNRNDGYSPTIAGDLRLARRLGALPSTQPGRLHVMRFCRSP
jgi:hypothetical protein